MNGPWNDGIVMANQQTKKCAHILCESKNRSRDFATVALPQPKISGVHMTEALPIVFVVDDDPSVRRAIKRLIESVGLQVELFGSAQEFLRAERPNAPSCLVLDIRLPGISGLDFQRELADANIHIPIVFITAHGDIPMTVRAMKAGAVEFLTKPFRDQDLLDAIHFALERDHPRRLQEAEVT